MIRFQSANLLCAWLCLFGLAAFSAESAPSNTPRASVFLITDYLPSAIYEGDSLSACFRIESSFSVKSSFEVTAKAVDATGAEVKTLDEKTTVAPGAFASVKFELDSKRVARIQFELKAVGDANCLGSEHVTLIRDEDPWPASRMANGRLVQADGSVPIPVVQKRRMIEERAFVPMKWIFGSAQEDAAARAGKCAALAPGAWALNIEGVRTLGPWPMNGSIPILNAMNEILSGLRAAPPGEIKRAAIVLPPEDLDFATDPRTYRVILDALLARLAKAGIGRVVLFSPFKYGCNDTHRKALWREIHESATVNAAKVLDPLDWMGEAQWRADPSTPNVYAQRPNAAGRKMIEQALADLIR